MNDAAVASSVDPALRLAQVSRSFKQGETRIDVLSATELLIQPGERVALVGPSGAGKSTLLNIAGLLERPDKGDVVIGGVSCGKLNDDQRTRMRRTEVGFVYQFHHLLPEFSALENVVMPQLIAGRDKGVARARAEELLGKMGLEARITHRPGELSGGEQQRVAITRAIANSPRLLLADEPTGNLDPHTAEQVYEELSRLVAEESLTVLIATHNIELAREMDRILRLEDGQLVDVS